VEVCAKFGGDWSGGLRVKEGQTVFLYIQIDHYNHKIFAIKIEISKNRHTVFGF